MILKCYPPSTNRDSCLYFREMKVTSKYLFEAVVRLEQIRRLIAEYRMKGGEDIVHTLWSLVWRRWLRVVHEDEVLLAGHWHL